MAEENNQARNANRTNVQFVPWHQNELVIRNIATFLSPTDLCNFRLVCKTWKEESCSIWKYYRTHHVLCHYSELGFMSSEALKDPMVPKPDLKPLTVFRGYRPLEMECNFDCVWAEELRDFFSRANEDDAQLKRSSFLVIKLKQWNRFGMFVSGEQEGARWFLSEIGDKIVHLTLDTCNLSISQGEFFPTLCKMTQLRQLIIKGTCFQLRKSVLVEPTLDEVTPLPNLKAVEVNYEKFTKKWIPKYNFPWDIFLGAVPELDVLTFAFSSWSNLAVAVVQFLKVIRIENSVNVIIFKNLLQPNQEPIIPKIKVKETVQELLKKEGIESVTFQSIQQHLSSFSSNCSTRVLLVASLDTRFILIKFENHQDGVDSELVKNILEELNEIQNEN